MTGAVITGTYRAVWCVCTTPAPAGGGPRKVLARAVEVGYVIDADGLHETGHRVLHSAVMTLTVHDGGAYLDGRNIDDQLRGP